MAFGFWSPVPSSSPPASPTTPKPRFSSYLLPTLKLPFQRRRPTNVPSDSDVPSLSSSPASSNTSSPATSPPSSLPSYLDAVSGDKCRPTQVPAHRLSRAAPETLRCSNCASDIAFLAQVMSKGFTGRHGRAYLVSPSPPASFPNRFSLSDHDSTSGAAAGRELLNTRIGVPETRQLVTGWHTVADITCAGCGVRLGWKYIDARDPPQYYKIGKFILETQRVSAFRSWEDVDADADGAHDLDFHTHDPGETHTEDDIVFDSEDEDECEDIFAGVWDPVTVAQRRRRKGRTR